jgi:hypothetical protein
MSKARNVKASDLHGDYPRRGVNLGKHGDPKGRKNKANSTSKRSGKRY